MKSCPAYSWYTQKSLEDGGVSHHCRHINCFKVYSGYSAKSRGSSTSTLTTHLKEAHYINCKLQTPLTHPHLLKQKPASKPSSATTSFSSSFSLAPSSASCIMLDGNDVEDISILSSPVNQKRTRRNSSSNSAGASSSKSTISTFSSLSSQLTIPQSFQPANNDSVGPALAKFFAVCGISHRTADSPEFKEFKYHSACIPPPDRRAVKMEQEMLASEMKEKVISQLKAFSKTSPISIAIDGWTNTRHHKCTNILCLCGGQAYYWASIVNKYHKNTARWLSNPIGEIIAEISSHGIRISAFVADNEAVNGALYNILQPRFPFMLLSPCAAHTIQLCVNRSLLLLGLKEVMMEMEKVLSQFCVGKHCKEYRQTLYRLQKESVGEENVKCLVKPCDTRWSSHLFAAKRLLALKSYIELCAVPIKPSEEFWVSLKALVDYLKPFQVATDIIQSDGSTLYTVYQQFHSLLHYITNVPSTNMFHSVMNDVNNIIVSNWKNHVNKPAAIMCAMLSFDETVNNFDPEELADARFWFIEYALIYIKQYNLAGCLSDVAIEGKLFELMGQFTGRAAGSPFRFMDKEINAVRSTQIAENRRTVGGHHYSSWSPASVWRIYLLEAPLLAHPAIALLSVAGSEAAVERSFSVQDSVHTIKRNRSKDETVHNELYIRMNNKVVKAVEEAEAEHAKSNHQQHQYQPIKVKANH